MADAAGNQVETTSIHLDDRVSLLIWKKAQKKGFVCSVRRENRDGDVVDRREADKGGGEAGLLLRGKAPFSSRTRWRHELRARERDDYRSVTNRPALKRTAKDVR